MKPTLIAALWLTLISSPTFAITEKWACHAINGVLQRYTPQGSQTVLGTQLEREIVAKTDIGDSKSFNFTIINDLTGPLELYRDDTDITYTSSLSNTRLGVWMFLNTHDEVRRIVSIYPKLRVFSFVEVQPTIAANVPEMRSYVGDCKVSIVSR
jgi:hypothetical protein